MNVVEQKRRDQALGRSALASGVTGLLVAGFAILGSVTGFGTSQPPEDRSADTPAYALSVDEESAAELLAEPKASTAGLIRWLKQNQVGENGLRVDRLVLSSRIIDREFKRFKESDVKDGIKKAADETGLTLLRLSVDLPPNIPPLADGTAGQRQITVAKLLDFIRLAADLGCKQIDFPLSATGFYQASRENAANGLAELWKAMAESKLDAVEVLIRNGSDLSSTGPWLADVITSTRAHEKVKQVKAQLKKDFRLGIALDISALKYQPNAIFRDLTLVREGNDRSPDAAAGAEQREAKSKAEDAEKSKVEPGADEKAQDKDAQKTDRNATKPEEKPARQAGQAATKPEEKTAAPVGEEGATTPWKECLIKAIVFEAYDSNNAGGGGPTVEIRGLDFFSDDLLKQMNFRGDVSIRYRGTSDLLTGLSNSRKAVLGSIPSLERKASETGKKKGL